MNTHSFRLSLMTMALITATSLTACGSSTQPADKDTSTPPQATSSATASQPTSDVSDAVATEVDAAQGRIAYTYEGGIAILDASTLESVGDISIAGFNRLSPAGDGRHLMMSTTGGFQLLDMGTYSMPHDDHSHFYVAEPTLTDVFFAAETPSHVIAHDEQTALFDDATGTAIVIKSGEIADADAVKREVESEKAHHGVAVPLSDGTVVITVGTSETRTGARAVDSQGKEIAASEDCPGIHGEAIAQGDAVVFGCQDGALIFRDGAFTKVDGTGQVSTMSGTESSPIVLGNFVAEAEQTATQVSLTDTASATMTVVDLPDGAAYSSLARDDHGNGLVLGTDGSLHVIDPTANGVTASHPVISAWELPSEWQQPRPRLFMFDGMAYIIDPDAKTLHVVHPDTGEIRKQTDLAHAPNELSGVSGGAGEAHNHG